MRPQHGRQRTSVQLACPADPPHRRVQTSPSLAVGCAAAAHVVVIGAGVVGTQALQMAIGLGARVTVLDRSVDRLRQLDLVFGNRITTRYSTAAAIEEAVLDADAVIDAMAELFLVR